MSENETETDKNDNSKKEITDWESLWMYIKPLGLWQIIVILLAAFSGWW